MGFMVWSTLCARCLGRRAGPSHVTGTSRSSAGLRTKSPQARNATTRSHKRGCRKLERKRKTSWRKTSRQKSQAFPRPRQAEGFQEGPQLSESLLVPDASLRPKRIPKPRTVPPGERLDKSPTRYAPSPKPQTLAGEPGCNGQKDRRPSESGPC